MATKILKKATNYESECQQGLLDYGVKDGMAKQKSTVTLSGSYCQGRTAELPRLDFNRQLVRFTRHALQFFTR
jgi:hypothetical protein